MHHASNHQFLPDVVQHEKGAFSADIIDTLKQRGHHLKEMNRVYGNMHAILWHRQSGKLIGIVDHRCEGNAKSAQGR